MKKTPNTYGFINHEYIEKRREWVSWGYLINRLDKKIRLIYNNNGGNK